MSVAGKTVVGLIPARGNSKGIPRKNLAPLGGRPLIAWSISSALRSAILDAVVVSSEDLEILEFAKLQGSETLKRPLEFATDEAASNFVIGHALDFLSQFDVLVLLQPTSPFRTTRHIDEGVSLLVSSEAESVVSTTKALENPELLVKIDETGFLQPVMRGELPERRQDFSQSYRLNGALYSVRTNAFRAKGNLESLSRKPYEMPQANSLDIDTEADLEKGEALIASGFFDLKTWFG
jgi:CMP-N-acetylneuraminic acid synthetase